MRGTPSLGEKDTLEKYLARLEAHAPEDYGGITEDHYKRSKLLAEATYFKKSKEEEKPTAQAKEGAAPLTRSRRRRSTRRCRRRSTPPAPTT